MRYEKHPLAAAFLLLISVGTASASSMSLEEQVWALATCTGRVSALATRHRATHDPASATTTALQTDFEQLFEALLPAASSAGIANAQARGWRTEGWVEIGRLLRVRTQSLDAAEQARTEADMARLIASCQRLILTG